jgi:ornithine decarboxylase
MEIIKKLAEQHGTPIILFSENEFKRVYQSMQSYLPRVKHHFALKPLPTKECVQIVSECDGYMDIASIGELELVKSAAPRMVTRTVYTHPIKKEADILTAAQSGIKTMVAENFTELKKIMKVAPDMNILLRIAFPNEEARCNLSERYGADEERFEKLYAFAHKIGAKVIGCSFHVGSQMQRPWEHVNAIRQCRRIYDWVYENFGVKFAVLDIGGGFPAKYKKNDMDLEEFCDPIRKVLDELFEDDVDIWSEPGRSIAANCHVSVTQVIGKVYKNNRMWYYLDDGVYGTYAGMMYEEIGYDLHPTEYSYEEPILSVFAGPTCDSIDVILKDVMYQPLKVGDYLYSIRIGAYGWASRTQFNLLAESRIIPYDFDLNEIEEFIGESDLVLV